MSAEGPTGSPAVVDGYTKLGFDWLAGFKFKSSSYDPVADAATVLSAVNEQIPASIKKYDNQKAILTGFMLPIKMEGGVVVELMLVSSPAACCYGAVPEVNEWVVVKMKPSAGVRPQLDVPVSLRGQLRVGGTFEGGYLTSIYALECEGMASR